ncbi:MAG: FliM/FliN family flagellar motor C-terminal domain-containing protein [Planctomycetia bacterium]|nr:FliM/FliN family flagellar motor C-terminal domain-containing protein [Planctomycetia bacterium]
MSTHSAKVRTQNAEACSTGEEFPNRTLLSPYLKKRLSNRTLPENIATDATKRWFVNAAPLQRQILTTILCERHVDVVFPHIGVGTSKTLIQRMTSIFSDAGGTEYIACRSGDAFRFVLLAPPATLRVLLDALLGYSPAELLTLSNYLERLSDAALTSLEYELLLAYQGRLLQLCPARAESADSEDVIVDYGRDLAAGLAKLCDKERLYWEESTVVIGEHEFSWAMAFVAKDLLDTPHCLLHLGTSADLTDGSTPEPEVAPGVRRKMGTRVESRDDFAELIVKVATGVIPTQRWRSLKPGDVLYTEIDAQELFTIEADGVPFYRGKPGISHGQSAIQLKEKL